MNADAAAVRSYLAEIDSWNPAFEPLVEQLIELRQRATRRGRASSRSRS